MRKIQRKVRVDDAQLIAELEARGVTGAKVKKVAGGHEIEVPDDADGVAVDDALRRHAPASLLAEIKAAKDVPTLRAAIAEMFEVLLAR